MEHHYLKMNLIDERWVPQCTIGSEGLFCTSIIKLLFCMCKHLLTKLPIVMKAQVQQAALFPFRNEFKGWLFILSLIGLSWGCCYGSAGMHSFKANITSVEASIDPTGQWVLWGSGHSLTWQVLSVLRPTVPANVVALLYSSTLQVGTILIYFFSSLIKSFYQQLLTM